MRPAAERERGRAVAGERNGHEPKRVGDASSKGRPGVAASLKDQTRHSVFSDSNAPSRTLVGVVRQFLSPDLQQQRSMSDAVPHHE